MSGLLRPLSSCFFLAILLLVPLACAATDPSFYDASLRPLEETRQVPYRIAVAPFDETREQGSGSEEGWSPSSWTSERIRDHLVRSLERFNCGSEVFALENAADAARADLVLKPSLVRPPRHSFDAVNGNLVFSGLLWFGTWVGGLFVPDATYHTELEMLFGLELPATPYLELEECPPVRSLEPVDLTFFERNGLVSWPLVQSFILPPFLTSDESNALDDALTARAIERCAGQLTAHLKENLEQSVGSHLAAVAVEAPADDRPVDAASFVLRCRIEAKRAIQQVDVFVNGQRVEVPLGALSRNGEREAHLELPVQLEPGRANLVHLEVDVGGERTTRTLRIVAS